MRILVAEDDRITRVSLVRQLEAWGHSVTASEDGEQAWDQYKAADFDLVLTDWEMPRLSGLELIKRIRAAASTHFVYLIMLTGRSDKSDVVSGIEAGADDFVAKPFDREELRVRILAGDRVVRLERALSTQNEALRAAGERMRHDLRAAARVQRAMLPRTVIDTPKMRVAWKYVPTDELAGDAIGLEPIDSRYLMMYVIDVSGHGVPAALLSVTAMHALAAAGEGATLLRGRDGAVRSPAQIVTDLNRRFCASDNDGRFLTMILCVLDTHEGRLSLARAGHPLPILLRRGWVVPVDDAGGFPLGWVDSAEYQDVAVQLEPGDRLVLFTDGVSEQMDAVGSTQFGEERFRKLLLASASSAGDSVINQTVDALVAWAGATTLADDVSLVILDWVS